jgi:hypothetical protein
MIFDALPETGLDDVFEVYLKSFTAQNRVIVDESFKVDFRNRCFRDNIERFIAVWTLEFENCKGLKGKTLFDLLVRRYCICSAVIEVVDKKDPKN